MKTHILMAAIAALLLVFSSCKKDENESLTSGLDASKTTKIKKGEPVNFKFSQAPEGSNVQWVVTPTEEVQINPSGNSVVVLFNNSGSYHVDAHFGALSGSSIVSVQDSIYNPGGGEPVYEPLTGDQIFITVSLVDSMGIDGLDFRYITEKKYNCLNHTLMFDNNFSGEDLQVVFNSVYIPSEEFCQSGEDFASSGTSWYPIQEGNHLFEVVLDGTTYSGSFVKSGSTYTFSWPYTSGVIISPLVIN